MTKRLLRLLLDRNFLLLSAVVLGLLLGDAASATQSLIMPALMLAMTVSVVQVSLRTFSSGRMVLRAVLFSLLLNYVLLGSLTLLLARWLLPDPELWPGFVLSAAVPCGIGVVPFSYVLHGDPTSALIGLFGSYVASLAVTPWMVLRLLGTGHVDAAELVRILVRLVILPLLLSRLLTSDRWQPALKRWRGPVVNWSFALVMFTIIGSSRDLMLSDPRLLLLCAVIAFACNIGLAIVLDWGLRHLGLQRAERVTWVLMGTIKNTSLAAAVTLALFGSTAAMPTAVFSGANVLYMVWLGARWGNP